MSDEGPDQGLELSAVLANLRSELQKAGEEGDGKPLRFAVADIDVELKLTTSSEGAVKGGMKLWVVDASAEGKAASQAVHTLRLKLAPVDAAGNPVAPIDSLRTRPPRG